MPKVSVIIPVYGVEKYIERCARSLFEQTLDDIEYLFIDDCSPDKSIEILKGVLEEYPHRKSQVTIHRMDGNSGQAKVREWGMKHATGDYVIHCDSDDWVDVSMYKKLYEKAKEENADVVFCNYYEALKGYNKIYKRKLRIEKKEDTITDLLIGKSDAKPLWASMVKHTILNNIIYPSGNQGEDSVIMLQAIYHSKLMVRLDDALYYYCINPNSICHTIKPEALLNNIEGVVENHNLIIKFLYDTGLAENFQNQLVAYKYDVRLRLWTLRKDSRCKIMWQKLYPEINRQIWLCPYISIGNKLRNIYMLFNQ